MPRRNDGQEKRAPLAKGHARRMTDARCAWKNMDAEQRAAFLRWLKTDMATPSTSPETIGFLPCPECGEAEDYRGIDERMSGAQTFTVENGKIVDYDSWDADIGEYTEVWCGSCEHVIWSRPATIEIELPETMP